MRRFLSVAFLILIQVSVVQAELDPRWKDLVQVVNKEIVLLEKSPMNARMELRLLELYTEKLKLVHEWNNHKFLEHVKNPKGENKPKEDFFQETQKHYQITKIYGFNILKKNPQHPYRHQFYMVMGLNSRDYGNDGLSEKLISNAVSLMQGLKGTKKHQAEAALAELHFNAKKFAESKYYYERVVKNTKDPWLTKHLINLAWCHIQLKNFDYAISLMKKAHALSSSSHYVKVADQVNETMITLLVLSGKPLDAMSFILNEEKKDPVPYLLTLARNSLDKGYIKETETILAKVENLVESSQWKKYKEDYLHASLDFYRSNNHFHNHLIASHKIASYYLEVESKPELKQDRKSEAIEKIRSAAGFLQVKVARDMKENESIYEPQEMKLVQGHFDQLVRLDIKNKSEYYYFKGESYYSVRNFKLAARAYQLAIAHAMKAKNIEDVKKPLNSLLALTAEKPFSEKKNKKYLAYAYTHHLRLWPRNEKSRIIYHKLFGLYQQDQEDKKAAGVLISYYKNYPEDAKVQQQLMAEVLNTYIEKKDTAKLNYWVQQMKKGFLGFDQETILKAEIALGNLLFLNSQNLAKDGQNKAAAEGFEKIYNDEKFSAKIRYQASYFLALSYMEMGQPQVSYKWLNLTQENVAPEDLLTHRKEIITLAERSYQLQDFKVSYAIAEGMLKKFCHKKDNEQQRFFEIGLMTALAEEEVKEAKELIKYQHTCLPNKDAIHVALAQIFQFYKNREELNQLSDLVRTYPSIELVSEYKETLQKWYWSINKHKKQIVLALSQLNDPEADRWVRELALFEEASREKHELDGFVIWTKTAFDPEEFNKTLEAYLVRYQEFKTKYHSVTETKQVDLAVASTRLFADLYSRLGVKLTALKPHGMEAQTMVEFQQAMKGLGDQFLTTSQRYENNLAKFLKDTEALSLVAQRSLYLPDVINPIMSHEGYTMDDGEGVLK
jgi:hypothetical protein